MNAMMAAAVSSFAFFIRPQMLEWSRPAIIRVSIFEAPAFFMSAWKSACCCRRQSASPSA
jgi:hypothetical protein